MSWSGVILVIVGALLLANNFGVLPLGWLRDWWPIFLIALGVVSIIRPRQGDRRSARVGEVEPPRRGDIERRP